MRRIIRKSNRKEATKSTKIIIGTIVIMIIVLALSGPLFGIYNDYVGTDYTVFNMADSANNTLAANETGWSIYVKEVEYDEIDNEERPYSFREVEAWSIHNSSMLSIMHEPEEGNYIDRWNLTLNITLGVLIESANATTLTFMWDCTGMTYELGRLCIYWVDPEAENWAMPEEEEIAVIYQKQVEEILGLGYQSYENQFLTTEVNLIELEGDNVPTGAWYSQDYSIIDAYDKLGPDALLRISFEDHNNYPDGWKAANAVSEELLVGVIIEDVASEYTVSIMEQREYISVGIGLGMLGSAAVVAKHTPSHQTVQIIKRKNREYIQFQAVSTAQLQEQARRQIIEGNLRGV